MSHSHSVDFKTAFTVEKLPDSQVKISGELPYAELQSERTASLVALGKNVEMDGFRKGNVPIKVLEKHLGEMTILGEMAERAISHAYPHIVEENKLEVIGRPQIEVKKIAPNNPLSFTITVAVIPEFKLPDYKDIAKDINKNRPSDEVSDDELAEKIKEIQKSKQAYERMQELSQKNAEQSESGDTEDLPTQESEADKKIETKPLPELTDEYVKTLGQPGQFETIEDFKAKLREHLEIEKKQANVAKHRADITDSIVDKTEVDLPKILIDSEINQMFAQMQEDIDRANLKMDDYLTHIKKTKGDLETEWAPVAQKRAKLQLILNEIAKVEEIIPEAEKVNEQSKELMERFKDADEQRVRLYVASVLLNEEVMKFLEAK